MKKIGDILYRTEPEKSSYYKSKICGKFITISHYEKPVLLGRRPKLKTGNNIDYTDRPYYFETYIRRKGEYERRRKSRALETIFSVVESNFTNSKKCVFLTLTFCDNLTDLKEALRLWHIFCVQFRKVYPDFKFIGVPEFQKRGAVHFHFIINLPWIDRKILSKYWRHGYPFVKKIYNTKGLGVYLSKYITKNLGDHRLTGFRSFYSSRGLIRPRVIYFDEAKKISDWINQKKVPITTSVFETEFNGLVKIEKFLLSKKVNVDKLLKSL